MYFNLMIITATILFSLISSAQVEVTPTELYPERVEFSDDLDFEGMDLAIKRQMEAFPRMNLEGEIKFGKTRYSKSVLKESLELFGEIFEEAKACLKLKSKDECVENFNTRLNAEFDFYRPVPEQGKPTDGLKRTKFTSYYSPDLHGSRVQTDRFTRPIYRTPYLAQDLNFSRVQIDFEGALHGKGLELFWVEESFFDLYLLHVQGGGRINLFNEAGEKEIKYLSYDKANTRAFKMIYPYMMEKGYITDASIENQRKFLNENPDKQPEIFAQSPSYIFFKESDEEPLGVNSIPLTEGRSLAIDTRIYKTVGLINFIKATKVTHQEDNGKVVKAPFSRFFIAQDTGGAIRGNARCDLYFGYGRLAELTAYNLNELGEQYFLIKKIP